jgi:hypothetical protein
MLKLIQEELAKLWTDELYSEQFRKSPSTYKDFDHALKHVRKAAQALENMTEEADHGSYTFDHAAIRKYVADIVISAIRLANVSPTEMFDIEKAVLERIERKMGKRIDTVEVKGICKKCRSIVPPGFYECRGDGSHLSMGPRAESPK